jgi:hypothetical protein
MSPSEFNSLSTVIRTLQHYFRHFDVTSRLWTRFKVQTVNSSIHILFGNLPLACISYEHLVNVSRILRYQVEQIDVHVINTHNFTDPNSESVPDMCIHIQLPVACLAYMANHNELHSSIAPVLNNQRVYRQAYVKVGVSLHPPVHLYDSARLMTQQKSHIAFWDPDSTSTVYEDKSQTIQQMATLEHNTATPCHTYPLLTYKPLRDE